MKDNLSVLWFNPFWKEEQFKHFYFSYFLSVIWLYWTVLQQVMKSQLWGHRWMSDLNFDELHGIWILTIFHEQRKRSEVTRSEWNAMCLDSSTYTFDCILGLSGDITFSFHYISYTVENCNGRFYKSKLKQNHIVLLYSIVQSWHLWSNERVLNGPMHYRSVQYDPIPAMQQPHS